MRLAEIERERVESSADVEKRVLADNPNKLKSFPGLQVKTMQNNIAVTFFYVAVANKAEMNTNKITSLWNLLAILLVVVSSFLASGEDLMDIVKPGKLMCTAKFATFRLFSSHVSISPRHPRLLRHRQPLLCRPTTRQPLPRLPQCLVEHC